MKFKGMVAYLRPLRPEDASITLGWRLSERAKFLNRGSQTVEQQQEWIETRKKSGDLNFIIEYRQIPVGMIALHDINRTNNHAVIGRLLIGEPSIVGEAPVALEAELILLDYAFRELKMHKIYGDIREDNKGVIKLRKYFGYHQDGILRDYICEDGRYINGVMVSLLEDEYWSNCRPKLLEMIRLRAKYCQ